MTEETKQERKFVTVTFPTRVWTSKEFEAFEEFVRCNNAAIKGIFINNQVMSGR